MLSDKVKQFETWATTFVTFCKDNWVALVVLAAIVFILGLCL